MFLGEYECTKKNHSTLPQKQKQKQNSEKKQNFSKALLSLFSFRSKKSFLSRSFPPHNKKKTAPSLSRCSRFHFKCTHLSSLRAQFREHTSSRAETSSLLFCVPSILRSVLREKRERERRESAVCGGCCVHHFDWKKKHTRR